MPYREDLLRKNISNVNRNVTYIRRLRAKNIPSYLQDAPDVPVWA